MHTVDFTLDERLAKDTIVLGDLALSRILLMNDSQYPWVILVPRRVEITELFHLSESDQQQLMVESVSLTRMMADTFAAKKMNVAALGNMVSQLHVHHIARFEQDPAWPGPVWGKVPARPYTPQALETVKGQFSEFISRTQSGV